MNRFTILLLSIAFLSACSSPKVEAKKDSVQIQSDHVQMTEAQMKIAGVETGVVVQQAMNTFLKVNGHVDVPPQNIVSVSFPMGGYLLSTKLLPGMHVAKGEVIATIEDQSLIQLQQDYLVSKSRLTYLKQEFERQKLLNENNVNAAKTFQLAESEYFSQKVILKGYGEKLLLIGIDPANLTEGSISRSVAIHSPLNGFVSKVNVNIGKYVTPTDVLFELINPDDMHAALTVFEKDLNKVKSGQNVKVSFVDEPGTLYDCEVILVTRNVDDNRSGLVHCHFKGQPQKLLPGMFLNASINIHIASLPTVPEEAVVRFENRFYVFVSTSKNEFQMVEVEIGVKDNGRLEVSSKLNDFETKTLVTKNAYALLSKMKNTAEE